MVYTTNMSFLKRTKHGSIIAFTIILLAILLASGLSVVTVASLEKKSSFSTQKSVVAFQAADSGIERILKRIYIDNSPSYAAVDINNPMPTDPTLNDVADGLDGVTAGSTCDTTTNKIVATSSNEPVYTFEVSFFDGSDVQISCSDTAWRDKVVRIKTEGFYRQTSRVIELGIKPRPKCNTTVDDTDGNTYDVIEIADMCWTKQSMRVGSRLDTSTSQTNNGTIEYYCYGDNPSNCTTDHPNEPDGGLYTWDEAMQYVTTEGAQGICPADWHIPSDSEWNTLAQAISPADPSVSVPWSSFGWRGIAPIDVGVALKPNGLTHLELNLGGGFTVSGSQGRDTGVASFLTSTENGASDNLKISLRDDTAGIARSSQQKAVYAHFVRCVLD